MLRRFSLVWVLVGCDSGAPTPVTRADHHDVPRPPAVAVVDAGVPSDAPLSINGAPGESPFAKVQRELGSKAIQCEGVAKILAMPPFDRGDPAKREQTLLELCTRDRWSLRVRECVATAEHDPLACAAYFGDPDKRARDNFNAYFERIMDEPARAEP